MRSIAFCLGFIIMGMTATAAAGRTDEAAPNAIPVATVVPVRPYHLGDKVWLTTPPVPELAVLAEDCQRVPATGYVGTNVYASSSAAYANYWRWSDSSSAQPFYWYIKRTDNSNADSGYSTGGGSSTTLAANVYYFKVQNKGASPQAWNVCYEVR